MATTGEDRRRDRVATYLGLKGREAGYGRGRWREPRWVRLLLGLFFLVTGISQWSTSRVWAVVCLLIGVLTLAVMMVGAFTAATTR